MNHKLIEYENELARQESVEHQNVLLALRAILQTPNGVTLFSYLFKNFNVGEMPVRGLTEVELHENLGFLRAGNSIYKLICEADASISASILSELERKRYEQEYHKYRIDNEPDFNNADS